MSQVLKKNRGFSLLEILVAVSVFFIVSILVFRFLAFSMRGTTKMNERGSHNASLVRSLTWLVEDLERSHISHLLIVDQGAETDPFSLGMVRTKGVDAQGSMTWEEQFTVYNWEPADTSLTRYRGASSPDFEPTNPVLPTTALLDDVITGAQTSVRRLSGDITDFEVTRPSGALIHVRLEAEDRSGKPLRVERTTRVHN